MSLLTQYAEKAEFMNVGLEIDGKPYKFNLDLQLKIQETKLNTELMDQPRAYAFLCMLRNKVKLEVKRKVKLLDRKKAGMYNHYAETMEKVTDINNKIKGSKTIRKMQDDIDAYDDIKSVLDICVDSFNQRKDLLQTLSSNLRIENK